MQRGVIDAFPPAWHFVQLSAPSSVAWAAESGPGEICAPALGTNAGIAMPSASQTTAIRKRRRNVCSPSSAAWHSCRIAGSELRRRRGRCQLLCNHADAQLLQERIRRLAAYPDNDVITPDGLRRSVDVDDGHVRPNLFHHTPR